MKLNHPSSSILVVGTALLACGMSLPARADYSSTVVSQAPPIYYRLNETAVPPPSVSATNLGTAAPVGNGTYSADVQRGVVGAIAGDADLAAGFTAGANLRVPYAAALNPSGAYTVEFWAKPNALGVFACPVSSTDFGVSPRLGWLFYQDSGSVAVSDGWVFRGYNSGGSGQVASPAGSVTTDWQHVVAVFDPPNNAITLYVNGQSAATRALNGATATPNRSQPLSLGVRYDDGFPFDGSLDEVAIYPTALSAAKVLAHFQAGTNTAPATSYKQTVLNDQPVGYWRLSELEGPPAANLGTLANAGTGHYFAPLQPGQPGPSSPTYAGFEAANKAVVFDGTGGSVKIPTLNLNTNTVSITAWVKANGAQTPKSGIVFCNAGTSVGGLWIGGLGNVPSLGLGYNWNNDAATTAWLPSIDAGLPTLQDGVWAFVALVVEPNQAEIYIAPSTDPIGFTSATNPVSHAAMAFDGPMLIGQNAAATAVNFKGSIDEVTVFNRSLGAGEVYSQFAAAVGGVPVKIFGDPQAPINTVYAGDTLTLAVDAGGTPPLTYQWYRGTTLLTGQTGAVLTVTNVQLSDSGDYHAVIQAAVGSALTSANASILVSSLSIPLVTQSSGDRTLYPGGTLNLSVTATGGGLTYFWSKNGTLVASGASSQYSILSVDVTNGGAYSVVVSNTVGTAPVGPINITVVAVTANSFEGAVVGDQPEAWWRLDEPSGSTTMWDVMGRHDGTYVGAPTLGVAGVGANKAVNFSGTAGTYGKVPFSKALNTADFALECWARTPSVAGTICPVSSRASTKGEWFWTYPSGSWSGGVSSGGTDYYVPSSVPGATILANSWTHMVLTVSGGTMRVYFNGQGDGGGWADFDRNLSGPMIIGGRGVSYNASTDKATVDEFMNGDVDEVIFYDHSLSAAQVQNHYQLALYGNNSKPVFKTQPQSQTVVVGNPVSFSAYVEGTLPLGYQWTKDGTSIAGATTTTLDFASVKFTDVGSYQLIATNSAGTTPSQPVTLSVYPVPAYANATNGLVLHLRFDNTYDDSSGRGNNGTPQGTPSFVSGQVGSGALHYFTQTTTGVPYNDNTNAVVTNAAFVTLGTPADLQFAADTSFSVSYWVRLPAGYTNGDLPFLCSATNSYGGWGLTFAPSYKLGGWSYDVVDPDGNSAGLYGADRSISDGQWHSLVHVFDRVAATATTYLDGVNVDVTSLSGVGDLSNTYPINIGQDPTGTYHEAGSADLDDLGIWRRALTPIEAYGIYGAGQNRNSFDTYGPVTLFAAAQANGKLVISWQGGTLWSAPTPAGPWNQVNGANPPNYVVTPGTANVFFRVQL